jgi:hypothetical protein
VLFRSDEGCRDTDWDSHLQEPRAFFTESEPCESCGKPVDCERRPASWDPELMVGPCCEFGLDIPELDNAPTCQTLWNDLERCKSVAEVSAAMEAHLLTCPVCGQKRKKTLAEMPMPNGQRRAA